MKSWIRVYATTAGVTALAALAVWVFGLRSSGPRMAMTSTPRLLGESGQAGREIASISPTHAGAPVVAPAGNPLASTRKSPEFLATRANLQSYFGDTDTARSILDFAILHSMGKEEGDREKYFTKILLERLLDQPEAALEVIDRSLDALPQQHERERDALLYLAGYLGEESKSIDRVKRVFEKELRINATEVDVRDRHLPQSAPVYALIQLLELDSSSSARQRYVRTAFQEQSNPKIRAELKKAVNAYGRGSEFDAILQ